jgi:hypothetical protein
MLKTLLSTSTASFLILLFQKCPSTNQTGTLPNAATTSAVSVSDTITRSVSMPDKMCGLSFVAPPRPFKGAVMQEVKSVKATWIATIPYGYTRLGEAKVHYNNQTGHWWGERIEGVRTTIDSAHRAGIKVMLKPQVYIPGGWTGGMDYATDAEWEAWESSYEAYLMPFVKMAIEKNVAAICVGTEFKIAAAKREKFWRQLIAKVRKDYKGLLTYASNWDEYPRIPFWDALDFVGIDAYMPLVEKDTPSVSELKEAWKPYFEQIKTFQSAVKKPIVFTEFGYLSVDGCAGKGWEVEKRVHDVKINQLAQANAIDALFATFWQEEWWHGGFLWKWFPDGMGHEGYIERDYTPQGKQASKILIKWYGQNGL